MGGRKQHDLSATDFRDPLLISLFELSKGQPGEVIPFKLTHEPTCKRMGIDIDTYGFGPNQRPQTVAWIGWAFTRYIRDKGLGKSAGRGKWTLTEEGIAVARQLAASSGTTADAANVMAKVEDDAAPTVQTIGVSLPVGPTEDDTNSYHDDPYIRSLAVAETKCFGAHTSRSPVCKPCGLAGACRNKVAADMSALADNLLVEDAKAAAEAARKAAEAAKPLDPEQLVKETAKPDPTPAPTNTGKWDNSSAEIIIAHVAAKCYRCGEPIDGGTEVYWIKDKGDRKGGLFHKECW